MISFDHIFIAPKNWDASLSFYKNNLGFNLITSWGEKSTGRGAVLKNGSFTIVIAEEYENKGDHAWSSGFNGSRPTIHLNTENVDQVYENLKNKEDVVIKPENNHWQTRWMVVKDPDNNLIAFNTPTK